MTAIDDAQARLRARNRNPQKEPWQPPVLADFHAGRYVLAFDATLTNCGWVLFLVALAPGGERSLAVVAKGTIRPSHRSDGFLGTWEKARHLQDEVDALIARMTLMTGGLLDVVVEAPSVGGGWRTESSLIAGMLVWVAMPEGCPALSATHVSAVLLGDPGIRSEDRKKRIRAAVIGYCPEAAGRDWNEHERDALATGLTHLWDLGHLPRVVIDPAIRPGVIVMTGIGEGQ